MANHFSALKRARQTVTRTEVNRSNRTRMRTSLRALREALKPLAKSVMNSRAEYARLKKAVAGAPPEWTASDFS